MAGFLMVKNYEYQSRAISSLISVTPLLKLTSTNVTKTNATKTVELVLVMSI